jgi:hypothetical protein
MTLKEAKKRLHYAQHQFEEWKIRALYRSGMATAEPHKAVYHLDIMTRHIELMNKSNDAMNELIEFINNNEE